MIRSIRVLSAGWTGSNTYFRPVPQPFPAQLNIPKHMLDGRSNSNERGEIYSPKLPLLPFYDFASELGNRQDTHAYSCGTKSYESQFCDQYSIICESSWKGHPLLASFSFSFPAHNWTSKMWQAIQYEWAEIVLKFIIHISSFSFVPMKRHLKLRDLLPQLMKNSDTTACRIPITLELAALLTFFIHCRIKTCI